ncbi:hypothetical protein NDA17_006790 [Ustilago hordei]|nr:hypothetical protein NDA17_006790 [Ustilago hordei]
MEAYNKLLALRLTSDAPGAATHHGIGHWARDCPSRRIDPLSSRPMGPKVMVTTADPFEEATNSGDGHTGSTETGDPEAMDLSSYQQSMDPDHEEEEHKDDDDEGNISKAVLELSGMVQDHPAWILADTSAGFSVSMQVSIGTHNLVAFYSRKMSSAKKNYEIHDKELLAVYRPGDKGVEEGWLSPNH